MTKTLRDHAKLVDQMATTLGVDLEEQVFRGNTDMDEITNAVLKCTGCAQTDDCRHWLASRTETAVRSPSYCRNSEMFQTLKG